MRPVATQQNVLRYSLNRLLATPAQVRLLRVLTTDVRGPVTAADAAERAGLTQAGARRALQRLSDTGVVRIVGGGRSQQFVMRETEPLTEALTALFQAELERYQLLIRALRAAFVDLPDLRVAWVEDFPADLDSPLHVGVLADSASIDFVASEVRRRVTEIETQFELTIELHPRTPADMPERDWSETPVLGGLAPFDEMPGTGHVRSHADRDRRAFLMSQAINELLAHNPSLTKRASRHVERLLDEGQGRANHDLREWQSILATFSNKRLRNFLTSDAPRAERLRQSSPFLAVLSPEERDEVLAHLERGA